MNDDRFSVIFGNAGETDLTEGEQLEIINSNNWNRSGAVYYSNTNDTIIYTLRMVIIIQYLFGIEIELIIKVLLMLIAVLVFVGYPIAFVIDHKRAKRAEKERKERLQTKVVYVQDNELDRVKYNENKIIN